MRTKGARERGQGNRDSVCIMAEGFLGKDKSFSLHSTMDKRV